MELKGSGVVYVVIESVLLCNTVCFGFLTCKQFTFEINTIH